MAIRHISTIALAAALLVPLSDVSAGTRRQADLLDRAVAAWTKVKTVRATFEQSITNSLTGRTLTAKGEYQQQRPGKFSVRFGEPANERIVSDGRYLWLYLPSSAPGQVIRTSASNAGGTVDLEQFLKSPRSRFTVTPSGTLVVGDRPTHAFTFVPKTKEGAPFQAATVWVDDADATVRQFEVTEPSGQQRKVRLTSFRTNVPVEANAFKFTVPAGVRVVER